MKIKSIYLLAFVLFINTLFAQSGKVLDDLTMKSDILKSERKFAIYLPPDYDGSTRSYSVLYLLHGGGDDQTGSTLFCFANLSPILDLACV